MSRVVNLSNKSTDYTDYADKKIRKQGNMRAAHSASSLPAPVLMQFEAGSSEFSL